MGLRGPVPKSKSVRKLTGNAGRRPLPKKSKAMAGEVKLECPSWVSKEAKEFWTMIVPALQADRTVTERDWPALVNLCQAWAEFQKATKTLEKEGRIYPGHNGMMCMHPAVKMQSAAMKTVNAFMEKFGLQPTTRSRLPNAPETSSLDQIDSYQEFRED